MQCPRCRAENRAGRRFCGECGVSLAMTCAACGFLNEGNEKFCGGCGATIAPNAAPSSPSRSPESYTPKHLAERILTSKAALEGERKQVTVLFADLKGSMELLADRDPEEARKILDPVLEHMMEAVHRYEGTVNQVMGDGIMALFGAPLAHEDHAVRACYAALSMQDRVKRHAEVVRRHQGVVIQIRIGLNSGEVVVRAIGSDLHMDYTAVGQTTHLAARMEQIAGAGSVYVAPATAALAEGFIRTRSIGPTAVKGLNEPVAVYELIGASAPQSRLVAHAGRGLTKFVGRATEMARLAEALDRARLGRGQAVGLVGEPGVGKSRLLREFAHSHRTRDCVVVQSSSVSYGKANAYLPVIALLRDYFQVVTTDDADTAREKVTEKVLSLDRGLESAVVPLLDLLDVPTADDTWVHLDPPERRQRTIDAVKWTLLRQSALRPLILVFEDLHWIDGETQSVLNALMDSLPAAAILLLISYRPEYQHAWGSKTHYEQLRIVAHGPADAEDLLEVLLGRDRGLDHLKQELIARTEGNAFFLEESVQTLVETRTVDGTAGAYRLMKAPETLRMPATVQAVVAARVDRLSPEDKRLLQAASVIGKEVSVRVLAAVADTTSRELRDGLARLQGAEFLYETKHFPDEEYTFKHAVTHEVTYGGLLQERRRDLHTRIVLAIESLHAEHLEEHIEHLARHAFRGEMWTKAVTYLGRAGIKAMARSALPEAAAWFEQALFAVARLPESQATREQGVDIRFYLRTILLQLGQHARLIQHLREAVTLATALDDQRRLVRALSFLVTALTLAGEYDEAIDVGHRTLACGRAVSDPLLAVEMDYRFAQVYHALGNYRRAVDILRARMDVADSDQSRTAFSAVVFFRLYLGLSLAELGEFAEGIARLEEAAAAAQQTKLPFDLAGADLGLGLLYVQRGAILQALPVLERAWDLCRTKNLQIFAPITGAMLGVARCRSGALREGVALLEGCAEATQGAVPFRAQTFVCLGEGYLLSDRTNDARRVAEKALTIARDHKERGYEAWALHLLGHITGQRDADVEASAKYLRSAFSIAGELGMRPLVAHCHGGLANLSRAIGKHHQAREHFITATTMYRQMDMKYWWERLDQEYKAL